MLPISGSSIVNILQSKKSGIVDKTKEFVLAGRERHSSSRYLNWGYPQRVIRKGDFIYIWNMKPERWPAGAPQRYNPDDTTKLWQMYGLDEEGNYQSGGAFTDIDDCPSKTFIIENHENPEISKYFELAVNKRPEFELYNVSTDPYCLNNLSGKQKYSTIEAELEQNLMDKLKNSNDPRIIGANKEIFDSYQRYANLRKFPKPQ